MKTVAVLGGGPAGASAARQLAASGTRTVLFDEKMAWEKPCGGGVTFKAYQQYPFLLSSGRFRQVTRTCIHTAEAGAARLSLDKPMLIFSRKELNQLLLDRAREAGAELRRERVLAMTKTNPGWRVTCTSQSLDVDAVIVATGARNPLRQAGTAFTGADSMTALGYNVPRAQAHIDIEFFEGFEGYIWVFPRTDHLSVGICGKGESAQRMRARLEQYMDRRNISRDGASFYAHMLPSLAADSWQGNRLSGDGWLAVGDAAGLVDPVTGEGIYYAMRSGELAGLLVASGRFAEYGAFIRSEFGDDLAYASTLARRLFLGRYLFGSNTGRLVQFLRRSSRLQGIVQQLFAGTLPYQELRRQIKESLHLTLSEIGVNVFLRRMVSEGME
ncbi:MAG: geranylgeranyl reductase family protein [Bryobacterales bacterium]|nr:geranylgeranyl reductase family protein [Bryobacterales bacterium]